MPFTQPKRLGFVALTFGLLLRMCFAGHYDVTYSGGTAEWVGPLGGHYTVPYTGSGGGWGGSAVTSDFVPPMMWVVGEPGWTHCHGSITVTFTWNNEGDSSELPPTTAILKQVGMASWSGDSGSCSDGLGDGQVLGDYSGTSSGTHYEIVGSPGLTFTRTITPDANSTAAVGGPSPEVGAYSGVSYQGTLTPVVLNISGVTKANSMKNALIGQHLTATLTASGYTLKTGTFVYSATGSYYKSVNWNPDALHHHTYNSLVATDYTQDSFSLFFWKDGVQTFTGSADLWINGAFFARVSATKDVKVYKPDVYYDRTVVTANSSLWQGLNPTYLITGQWSGLHTVSTSAVRFEGSVSTPAIFRTPGVGTWGFTQTVNSSRKKTLNGNVVKWILSNGFVLDSLYPYGFEVSRDPNDNWEPADGGPPNASTSDSPSTALEGDTVTVHDQFRMFQDYLPPDSGLGSEHVATTRRDWNWDATATLANNVWSLNAGPHVTAGGSVDLCSDTYIWTDNITSFAGGGGTTGSTAVTTGSTSGTTGATTTGSTTTGSTAVTTGGTTGIGGGGADGGGL